MVDKREEMTGKISFIFKAIEQIKKERDGQYKENVKQICEQEFGLT